MRLPAGRGAVLAFAVVLALGTAVGVMAAHGEDHGRSADAPGQTGQPPESQNGDNGRSEDAPGHNKSQEGEDPEDGQRDIKGIPDDNPNFAPVSGECDKGETAVKTTPSGTQVNVPCHAAENAGGGHGTGNPHQDSDPD